MLLSFRPAVRKKLIEFAGFHGIDSGEHVSKVCNWVDIVALAGDDEREVNSHCFAAGIRADEKKIFPGKNKVFDCSFGPVVVYFKMWIAKKAVESDPVLECVINACHDGVCGVQGAFQLHQFPSELFGQRLRLSTPDGEPMGRRFAFDLFLDVVELGIYLDDVIAKLVVSSAGMSAAANFGFRSVLEQGIESAGSISLHVAGEAFEKFFVANKRLIWRKIKNVYRMFGVTAVDGHLTFAHGASGFSILDFDGAVIGLNDLGIQCMFFEALIEWFKGKGAGLKPVTQRGAWDDGIFALEDFRLAVLRQAIVTLVYDCGGKQARSWKCSGDRRTWLLGHDDMLLAFWAGAHFLLVFKALDALENFLQLIADFISDKDSFHLAVRADHVCVFHLVRHRVGRHVLEADVFRVITIDWLFWRLDFWFFDSAIGCHGGLGIMAFGLRSEILAVALFLLLKQFVELGLQLNEERTQLGIAFQRLFQLLRKAGNGLVGFFKLSLQSSHACALRFVLFPQPEQFPVV